MRHSLLTLLGEGFAAQHHLPSQVTQGMPMCQGNSQLVGGMGCSPWGKGNKALAPLWWPHAPQLGINKSMRTSLLYSLNVAISDNGNIWTLPADIPSEDIPWSLNILQQLQRPFHLPTFPHLRYWMCCKVCSLPSKPLMFAKCLEIIWWKAPQSPSLLFLSQKNTFAEQEEQKNELWVPNKHSTQVNLLSSCILLRQIAYFHC